MAVQYNPGIVTDGLIMFLDAANIKSYPRTGTTWFDLTGNGNNGTFINGPSFNSANGGVIVLDGVNDYIDISLNLTSVNYTVIGASRFVVVGGRTFSGKNNNWLMGHWFSSTVKHFAEGWVTDTNAGEQSDTNWRVYAASRNTTTSLCSFYVNSQLDTANTNGSAGPNGFAIGSWQTNSEFSNSHISYLMAYNKVLSLQEISQNFNALRGRFGI